jgi:hypothetical protein
MLNKLFLLPLLLLFMAFARWVYNYIKPYPRRHGGRYHNTIPEVMIEEEYIRTLSIPDSAIYRNIPSFSKKRDLDEFISNNKDLVDKINIESAQNYVNTIIAESHANDVNGVDGISVINKISTQPFVITLDSGAILNVVPVVKKIIMDGASSVDGANGVEVVNTVSGNIENVGIVQYDLESTISNVKSQISIEDEREKEVIYKEIDAKVIKKVEDYIDSGLKAASISAVVTSLSI